MNRKPRFKVQRQNDGEGWSTAIYGNKRWLPVYDNNQRLGFTLAREEADALYWQMVDNCPEQTYRIVEKR